MKTLTKLSLLVIFFIALSCEKSTTDPVENNPLAVYDDIELNEINVTTTNGYEWHIDDFDVTYQNSKLYFNIHTKKDFDASLHFILVNFAVDSFPFGVGTSNIVNLRYPDFDDEYGWLVDKWATSYNGDFPSGYFVIDFIDTTELIIYGYYEFMNLENPSYPNGFKIKKSYFKVNYEFGTNSLNYNAADILLNSNKLNEIDIPTKNHFPYVHSQIVFDDNAAVYMSFFHEKIEIGVNHAGSQGFYQALWWQNIDFPVFYYGYSNVVYQADSGYVNIIKFDNDTKTIEGDLNLYYKNDNLTGSFIINY